MNNNDAKKWMLIYGFGDGNTQYLSQSQRDLFAQAVLKKDEQVILKDGRILPVRGARIQKNPDYVDPERARKVRELVQKNWEKLKARQKAKGAYYNPYDEK